LGARRRRRPGHLRGRHHRRRRPTLDALATEHGFAPDARLLFIDHDKAAYLPDLQSISDRGWLHRGSIVVADNMLIPGLAKYREFMTEQQGKLFDTVEHKTHGEYQTLLPTSCSSRSTGYLGWPSRRTASPHCARGCAPAHTSRSAVTVTIV
jgi:hypothetical protein